VAEAEVSHRVVVHPGGSEVWMKDSCGDGFFVDKNLGESAVDCLQHGLDERLACG